MRTTLDIDDDVLHAAKELARRDGKTAGQVVSELVRHALTAPAAQSSAVRESPAVYGLRPFARGGTIVTNAQIDQLREDDAY
jgi:Arc/MetJ family transcription regulator